MSSKKDYNQFQLFVLSFLTTEEQRQDENKLAFGKPIDHSLPMKFRYATTVSELSLKIPPTFIPDQKSGRDILHIVIKYVDELKEDGLLATDTQYRYNEPENEQFYVTASGRLLIRRHYQGIISVIENKKRYEQIVDNLDANLQNKKYLKDLRNKLKDKTEDAIISTVLSEAITGGVTVLLFLVHLLMHTSQ
jgi:hypothetical protein